MVISTLTHCAFLRALADDMIRWSMRCRRWKLMVRTYEEVVVCRSELSKVLLDKGPRHTPVQQCLHHLAAFSMRTFRVNGTSSISYSSRLNRDQHLQHSD